MDREDQLDITEEMAVPPSVGTRLRQCREARHLTLEEAAEATKISKAYLAALEEDRFQDLPAPAYLQAFIRTYAVYLGLPAEELLSRLNAAQQPGFSEQQQNGMPQRTRLFRWELLLLPVLLLGALLVSTLFQHTSSTPRPRLLLKPAEPQPALSSAKSVALQPRISSTALSPAVTAVQPSLKPESSVEQVPTVPRAAAGLLLSMRVKRHSTVTVTIDEGASQGYELEAGDRIEWKAARVIALDLSDVGSVELDLDGKPVALSGQAGRSAYITLDANGIVR